MSETANQSTQKSIYEASSRNAFRNLMQSAEDNGLLTAKKIAAEKGGGFYDHEIAHIFNDLTSRRRRNLKAITLTDPLLKRRKGSEKRELIKAMGACAIIQEDGNRHWITVEGRHREGGYKCFDPDLNDPVTQRASIIWKRGLLVAKPHVIDHLSVPI